MYPARPTLLVIVGFSSLAILSGLAVSSSPTVTHASPQTPAGKQQFISRCAACHGEDGHGGQLGPNIIDVANPRATSADAVRRLIRSGIPSAGMPAFTTLSDAEVDAIAAHVMSLKTPAVTQTPAPEEVVPGDVTAGFRYFTNQGNCATCHAIRGRGGVVGPDLVSVGQTRTAAQIEQALLNPGSLPATQNNARRRGGDGEGAPELPLSYSAATINLNDGKSIRGALRRETNFDLELMALDNHLYLLPKDQISTVTRDPQSLMPKVQASPDELKNLIAYLALLNGDATAPSTPLPSLDLGKGIDFSRITHPVEGEWPSYNGNIGGNRFSPLTEIDTAHISQLAPRWMWIMPGTRRALENTPQVIDGIMYSTGSNE